MRKNHWCTTLILLLVIHTSKCKICDCYPTLNQTPGVSSPQTVEVKTIRTSHILDHLKISKPNVTFGFHLIAKNEDYFLTYISQDYHLILLDLFNENRTFSIESGELIKPNRVHVMFLSNDTIHLLNIKDKEYYQLQIIENRSLKKIYSFDFSDKIKKNHFFMVNPGDETIEFRHPYLLIPYGNTSEKNYLDKKAYLRFNVINQTIEDIIDFPECYYECDIYDKDSRVEFDKDGDILCVFNKYPYVYKYTITDKNHAEFEISNEYQFVRFDKHKEKNLAYIRNYLLTDEKNVALLIDKKGNSLVIKRNKKVSLKDPYTWSFYLFDDNFKKVHTTTNVQSIHPLATFPYRDGYLIFNDSMNKASYYALKG